jgi:hypothetical protein
MEGRNETPFPAILLTSLVDDDRMTASMIARATFDIEGDRLTPAVDQPWVASVEPWDSPLGAFEPDQPYRKGGVDVFVRGSACAPRGEPAKEVSLEVEIGSFRASAIAVGQRVWQKGAFGNLVPSEPIPFVSLLLGLDVAFGGTAVVDGLTTPFPLNPNGKGFYVDEDAALHQPLPQLEDPANRISKWNDRPEPVGFGLCQYPHPIRVLDAIDVDRAALESASPEAALPTTGFKFTSRVFNRAFPRLVAPAVKPDDRVVVSGFSPDGPLSFVVPRSHLRVRIELGEKTVEREPTLEEIGIDVAERRVFLGYRYPFRYFISPFERRICTLLATED